jgi:hypothetical protein
MKVRRMNRVELLLPGEDIPDAARVFNELLGGHLPEPYEVPGQGVLSTSDYALGIEFYGPVNADSPRASSFDTKPRRGSIGPLVWEVDDLDAIKQEVVDKGYRVQFEFGEPGARQVHLDAGQLFGYGVTFTERSSAAVGERPAAVRCFHRVELLMAGDDIEDARRVFSDLLGSDIAPVQHLVEQQVLTTVAPQLGIELLAPASRESRTQAHLERKGRGAIGPLVWEVDDLDAAKQRALDKGFGVSFEYGEPPNRQVHLDAEQLFGYGVTFTERHDG